MQGKTLNPIRWSIALSVARIMLWTAVSPAAAAVVEYTDGPLWQSSAGPYTTIHFTELPSDTLVTNQYESLGALFTDGSDYILTLPSLFTNDDSGLNGAFDSITVQFVQPMTSIAVEYPGGMTIELYWHNALMYTSAFHHSPTLGIGFFGLTSDVAFDQARIFDPSGDVFIDDLHFGPPIPAPPMLALLAVAGVVARGRRRTP